MADVPTRSMAEILKRRKRGGFVGREAPLALCRDNLALPVDDERRRLRLAVHGGGGVGKTFLVERLRRVTVEVDGWAAAVVDDSVFDIPETLAAIAEQLESQGVRLKRFGQRYAGYRKRKASAGSDEASPAEETASLVTQTAVKIGLTAARSLVPGGGVVAGGIKSDDAAERVDHIRVAAGKKLRGRSDAVMSSPAEELTTAFIESLNQVNRPIAMFFDTYERTSSFLDDWLRDVFERLPADVVVTVAGRYPLDSSLWSAYLGILADLPLSVFTDVEARQLLTQAGVTDEQVISSIIQVSGGLPLSVAMLAANRPSDLSMLNDVTGSVVERFLQWEGDPALREIALAASLPRRVDRDVLAAVLDT